MRNWFGDLASRPHTVVEALAVDDIVAVMRDADRYPSPVRAHGSTHSTTLCWEADGGTVIDMTKMNRILEIGPDSVRVEAGALNIDVAKELERHGLQYYVNIELGNATLGSLACSQTKDASMPGEYGQVNSYCIGMKMVTPSGEVLEVTEDDPELLQAARTSFGLLGVVYEVTFKVRPLQEMSVEHGVYKLGEFSRRLPELIARGDSMMMYIFPFAGARIVVEYRGYSGRADESAVRPTHFVWRLRNLAWKAIMPSLGYYAERIVPIRSLRYEVVNGANRLAQGMMLRVFKAGSTVPTDQMIRYPEISGRSRYTFSIWAFPEAEYAETIREYFQFVNDYYRRTGFRPNMTHVGYRIEQDQSSLLSYTYDSTVLTIDPVSTGAPGWKDFLDAYNVFCSDHNGSPLFNQTWGIKAHQSRKAFGDRLARFEVFRKRYDPGDRLLNAYFREVIVAAATSEREAPAG